MPETELITEVVELRRRLGALRGRGLRIGLVPTMGALHAGHLSLVRASQSENDATVVSIYVNPSQFGPREDFGKYPRTLDDDLRQLNACGAEYAFVPLDAEVYRPGHCAWVEVGGPALPLEGARRPGHFRGVATIVLKLMNIVQPDRAYFGQKDFQQCAVVRQMLGDLDLPIEFRLCPTVRESDGLAMSSRNRYLSPAARAKAPVLWQSLQAAAAAAAAGERDAAAVAARIGEVLASVPEIEIDYVALFDPATLEPVARLRGATVAALAVRLEGTRLIDNVVIECEAK